MTLTDYNLTNQNAAVVVEKVNIPRQLLSAPIIMNLFIVQVYAIVLALWRWWGYVIVIFYDSGMTNTTKHNLDWRRVFFQETVYKMENFEIGDREITTTEQYDNLTRASTSRVQGEFISGKSGGIL